MQDRYVGDIGDFAKYGLLRRLTAARANGEYVWAWCGASSQTKLTITMAGTSRTLANPCSKRSTTSYCSPLFGRSLLPAIGCISAVSGAGLLPERHGILRRARRLQAGISASQECPTAAPHGVAE